MRQEAIGEGQHVPDQSVLDISAMGTISPSNDDQCCHSQGPIWPCYVSLSDILQQYEGFVQCPPANAVVQNLAIGGVSWQSRPQQKQQYFPVQAACPFALWLVPCVARVICAFIENVFLWLVICSFHQSQYPIVIFPKRQAGTTCGLSLPAG